MKKTIFILSLALIYAMSSYSQTLKVTTDGKVNINNVQINDPFAYTLLVNGYNNIFTTDNGTHFLRFQVGTSNPRICGTGNSVVFYNGITSTFNDIQVRNLYQNSDKKAKTNILPISNGLDKIINLKPVTFNWINGDVRKSATGTPMHEIGFIAQDVEEVLPEAVIEDDEGHKLVNYSAVIPLLTEAVKELSTKIEKLEKENETLKNTSPTLSKAIASGLIDNADSPNNGILYQNNPNPFSESTQIKYFLPNTVNTASLCIYNLQGKQLKQLNISERGNGSKTITASEFSAGIYLYALIADGKEINVKRMILTE